MSLEHYLKQATRGLWGKRKLELHEELEAHILEKAERYELTGATRAEAIAKVIAELGEAQAINRAMKGVHVMPTAIKVSLLAAAVMGALLLNNRPGVAQVATISTAPVGPCDLPESLPKSAKRDLCKSKQIMLVNNWLSLDGLAAALERQRVPVKRSGKTLEFQVQGVPIQLKESYRRDGQSYIVWWKFWNALFQHQASTQGFPIRMTGWANPRVSVGDVVLDFGTPAEAVISREIYVDFLLDITARVLEPKSWVTETSNAAISPQHRVRLDAANETVVGIVTRDERGLINLDVAPVKNGVAQLYVPQPALRFVGDMKKLSPYKSGGRVNAVLVKFTGEHSLVAGPGYEVVLPTVTESDARK